MNKSTNTFALVNQPEYYNHFWDYLMGKESHKNYLDAGRKVGETFEMPTTSGIKFDKRLAEDSLFRQLATCYYAPNSPSKILAKVNDDSATWGWRQVEIFLPMMASWTSQPMHFTTTNWLWL